MCRLRVTTQRAGRRPLRSRVQQADQHAHGMHGIQAAGEQHFQHVVERLGIRTRQGHQRQNVGQFRKQRRFEQRTACDRPAAVALHGVDLAVVRQVSIRMRKPPLRQRVGGKALVKYHHRGFHARILQIGIELRQKLGHDHALVNDRARGERREVENRILRLELFLAAAARHEQFSVEGGLVDVLVRIHEDLLDDGQALQSLRTASIRVRGQRAKSGELQIFELQLGAEHLAGLRRLGGIAIQEYEARGKHRLELQARLSTHRSQERGRLLDQQSTAIAGLAVVRNRATVRQPVQRADGSLDNPVAGAIIQAGDQTKAAGVLFMGGAAQSPIAPTRIGAIEVSIESRAVFNRHVARPI